MTNGSKSANASIGRPPRAIDLVLLADGELVTAAAPPRPHRRSGRGTRASGRAAIRTITPTAPRGRRTRPSVDAVSTRATTWVPGGHDEGSSSSSGTVEHRHLRRRPDLGILRTDRHVAAPRSRTAGRPVRPSRELRRASTRTGGRGAGTRPAGRRLQADVVLAVRRGHDDVRGLRRTRTRRARAPAGGAGRGAR